MKRICVNRRAFIGLCGAGLAAAALPAPVRADELAVEDPDTLGSDNEGTFIPEESLTLDDVTADDGIALMRDSSGVKVVEYKGSTRYETAASIALDAYNRSEYALIASGNSFADSLAASGLAGALGWPVVLADYNGLSDASANALKKMGATKALILGGESVVSSAVVDKVKSICGSAQRIWGSTRYETQQAILDFGTKSGLWDGEHAFIASAWEFADALAAAPLAFSTHAPIFFVDEDGNIPSGQKKALEGFSRAKKFLIVGGTARISGAAESYLSSLAAKRGGSVKRLAGETRYETSAKIGEYAVANLGFSWDGVAFSTGGLPYDALAGGVLQGKSKSPLLLIDSGSTVAAMSAVGVRSSVKFFGGYDAISTSTRSKACLALGLSLYSNASVARYAISLSRMAELEANTAYSKHTAAEFERMLGPDYFTYNTWQFLQFALLDRGNTGVSADSLNKFVASNCSYSEGMYGRESILKNCGQYFAEASSAYGVNEVYLFAHAIWESGWGCSELACGWTADKDYEFTSSNGNAYSAKKGTTYYNFYGIGAYDSNALSGGREMAVKQGWTSPRLAILGAAKWIANNYIARSGKEQNTLYLMKFDLPDAVSNGSVWHQYCTGGNDWVLGISRVMANCYSSAGYNVGEIPVSYRVPKYDA